jgi:hypothetical protein
MVSPVSYLKERSFQAGVIELARTLRWEVFFVADSRGSPRGWPDLVLCRDGVLLFRELKNDNGRLRREQETWGSLLVEAGQDRQVWRPSDWQQIEATLKGQFDLGGGVA